MEQTKLKRMRKMIAEIQSEAEEFARTPEAEALDARLDMSRNIIALLKSRKMTQVEFCRKIGMKPTQLSRIVKADENVTITTQARIAHGFGVPIARLLKTLPKSKEAAAVK